MLPRPFHRNLPPHGLDGQLKLLFIIKKNSGYGYVHGASGLINSAQFVVDMLNANKGQAKLVTVTDNNDIDRKVFQYKPNVVIIESFWVVPDKFVVLKKLHPGVRWIVHGHSDLPFLAQEGQA